MVKKRILGLIAIGLFLLYPINSFAQKRFIKKADTAFKYHMYNTAVSCYQKAFTKLKKADKEEKNRILFQIAEAYRYSGQSKKAISQYKRCLRAKQQKVEPKIYLSLANLQLSNGFFEEANLNFEAYLDFIPDDSIAIAGKEASLRAEEAMQQTSRYDIQNIRKINSRDGDWNPKYYTPTGDIIAFTSTREGVTGKKLDAWTGQRFSDIFVSKIDAKGDWCVPEKLDKNEKTSTASNESDASFCNEGNTMYYTYCGNEKKTRNRCTIRTSTFNGTSWSEPLEVNINGDTVSDFIHPFITADGKKLFFSSNKEGGEGDMDIWYATGSGSNFTAPVNLGSFINTDSKEAYPYLRNDTLFYFASTGHHSLGGYDIFKATLKDTVFTDVENLGYPINTNADDFGICFLPSMNKGMFCSNRSGGRGNDDIFSFFLPDILYTLSGTVKSDQSMQALADVEINLVGSDGMIIRTLTNSKGFYKFLNDQINQNVTYKILVEKKDYLGCEATETTVGLTSSKDFVRNFSLQSVPKGPVILPNILYDLAKWNLKPQYQDSLMGLIVLLEKNPRLVIELASHTDSRPIAMSNDSLSQYRAQSVVEYLILRGIHPERLIAKGYGARVPRTLQSSITSFYNGKSYTFDSGITLGDDFIATLIDKNQKEAAHQLNRRTEFSVLRDDFIPSGQSSISSMIGLANLENANKVPYEINPSKNPEIRVIANGTGMKAVVNEKAKFSAISLDAALRLLQIGKLTKNDFKNGAKAFDQEGEVLPNQKVQIKEIKVGRFYIDKIEMLTQEELPSELLLNKVALHSIGKYQIDTNSQQIIFEK
ncbi:MAG: OmpA family protein [Bacteroidales bacterium]